MAKTLLNGVNDVLKRVRIIRGQVGELSTLTDSGRQGWIDIATQAWNESVEQLYETSDIPLPMELGESTITLVTSDRDYALASDLNVLRFPLLDETNGQVIREYPGGYINLVNEQIFPASYTGLPYFAAIRPTDGELYLDRIPTSDENGNVYKYRYDKDVSLSLAADTFPFADAVYRAMVPVVAEVWKREERKEFDDDMYRQNMGRASRLLRQQPMRTSWLDG